MGNLFDDVAKGWERDEMRAFYGNPVSNRFYQLENIMETKIVGKHFPQTSYINTFISQMLSFHEFPDFEIKFDKIELYSTSKLTDSISTGAISAYAFILSHKAIEVFKQCDLGKYKIFPATVVHKENEFDYYVLQFINDFNTDLDFNQSKFYVANMLSGYEFDIKIKDINDFKNKFQLVHKGEWPGTEEYWYIRLKLGVFKKETTLNDIFSIDSSTINPYISSKLRHLIIDNKLTGFKINNVYNILD
jgi:hypothetical protein